MARTDYPARISAKSVFEVDGARLGIGVFDRPLQESERQSFRRAWRRAAPPGLEDLQLDPRRVSFVARPESVEAAWKRIDAVLARATGPRTDS